MSDIRDVLQHRSTVLAQSLRSTDEFDVTAARSAVRRKRTVRATAIGILSAAAVVVVGAGALAGYSAMTVDPAASPSPSTSPSASVSPSPSATPSADATPTREAAITNARALELGANPRTGETWQQPEGYTPSQAVVEDESYWVLAKIGEHDGADIVAVAPSQASFFTSGAPIAALLEFDADGVRVIACPSANADAGCSDITAVGFTAAVVEDRDTFYDTLTLPPTVEAAGGVVVATANLAPLGDASTWEGIVSTSAEGNGWSHYLEVDQDAVIGSTPLALMRTYGKAGVDGLSGFDYAIRTPFGSYVTLAGEGIATLAGDGFAWDDGEPQVFTSSSCDEWGCGENWVGADTRCYSFTMTREDSHKPSEWTPAGTMADGRPAFAPTPDNGLANEIFTTMRDTSYDVESDAPNYPFASLTDFLDARSLVAFETEGNEWMVAITPGAQNDPYECA